MATKIIGVIPARYGAKRFPGKPLAMINGKPMIQWVYERASKSKHLQRIIVATEDRRIMNAVWNFGGEAMLTSKGCKSGTDRVAEVSRKIPADIIINIQGDEPLIAAQTVDRVAEVLKADRTLQMSTAASPMKEGADSASPNVVKAAVDSYGNALYFSRSPIPYHRNPSGQKGYFRHHGIYGYRRNFLQRFAKWKPTPLELSESLEQLRALEHGVRIRVAIVRHESWGVDTKEDLEKVRKML
jgi:3-deoxy-manno-octulosonate cytidylyltransferase (CMP-KDO synthetase)